jgi:STE24 endopeptidase
MKASVKTKKAIGALAGIGNTRRIILSDTLLNKYTPDEIECVIGHELGHHVYRHLGKLLAMVSVLFFVGLFIVDQVLQRTVTYFGFSGIGDIASLPLLALVLGLFFLIVTPIQNTISRKLEGHADQYELELVNKPDAHISLMVKLYDQNLRHADPHPIIEFIYHSHPSGKKRIERARRYKRSRVYG